MTEHEKILMSEITKTGSVINDGKELVNGLLGDDVGSQVFADLTKVIGRIKN